MENFSSDLQPGHIDQIVSLNNFVAFYDIESGILESALTRL